MPPRSHPLPAFVPLLLVPLCIALAVAGCSGSSTSPTSPSDPAPVAAEPTITESFTGTVGVQAGAFYSFEVTEYGTVNLTLQNAGGVTGVPDSVWLGLGLGVPEGTDCTTTTSLSTQAGGEPQITSVVDAGIYCARVYDIGNLAVPAPFSVLIAHP